MNEVRVWSEQSMGKGWKAICHHQFDRHRLLIGEWFHNVGVLAFSINQDADLLPDVLPNTFDLPLVSERMQRVIEAYAPFSVQCLKVHLETKDGVVPYYLLNLLSVSRIEYLHTTDVFRPIPRRRVYFLTERRINDSICPHHLMRDERTQRMFISAQLARQFERMAVTGIHFEEIQRMEEFK